MNKEVGLKNSELVILTNSNFVLKKSSFVEHSLELVSNLSKQELRVVFADYIDGSVAETLSKIVKSEKAGRSLII